MDVLFSIVTGLGLRIFLDGLQEPLGRLGPVLLGLWEGAAVHQLSITSSFDHYLAYALRVAIDLYFTANFQRTFVVLLWTLLGVLAFETVNPSRRPRERRRRSSRSVPTPESQPTPRSLLSTSTPVVRPSRPPTPPSFFLEGESETNSNSPNFRYLPSAFPDGKADSDSPPPKPVLLPTPPATLVSDGRDVRGGPASEHRLSTIEEQSSGEEGSTPEYFGVPGGHIGFTRTLAPYAPSAATTAPPLPVPNSTIRYIQTSVSRASPAAELELDAREEDTYPPSVAPLPVPNPGTMFVREDHRPGTPSDGGDPLQTPLAARWELTDNDDGLTTPPGHARELSPLVMERNLFPAFGSVLEAGPSEALAMSTSATEPAVIITTTTVASVATVAGSSSAQGQAALQAVEYSSTPVAPDAPPDPDPDLATLKPDPEQESKSSYPTPDASPTTERIRDQQQQHDPGSEQQQPDHDHDHGQRQQQQQQQRDEQPDLNNFEAETETETDATSVISPLPARAMYARAEALRTQARAAEAERARLAARLNQAASEERVRDVLFLKEDIRMEDAKATKLHERAARRFIVARNASKDPQTVDVHGLRKAEAIRITEKALRDALTQGHPFVRVIVGKGLHSANGVPVLKEAVMKTMFGYKIPCRVDPRNAGVLILTLPSS
ncbi:hypothetical protein D9615_004655 [Tricholomella constricta]|uniref:Smr domain-containing protein n=1 Tax=Tricholomella constricta TaxID=117010 RepID=A0A8H5HC73_9AGAR|nr:hypothetical protein D9615_004655 [Tricholomella constricta]